MNDGQGETLGCGNTTGRDGSEGKKVNSGEHEERNE